MINQTDTVEVSFGFGVIQVNGKTTLIIFSVVLGIYERDQYMDISAIMRYGWKDEFLTWRPDMNSGITHLSIPSADIWKPDMVVYNSIAKVSDMDVYQTNAIVYHDGTGRGLRPTLIHFAEGLYLKGCSVFSWNFF